jgi:hypothetical protein
MKLQKSLAVGLLSTTAVLGAAIPASAVAAEPNVSVLTTRFDKLTYQPGETAAVSFKFRNWGSVDAVKVAITSGGGGAAPSELEITDFGGLRYDQGITIKAGEIVSVVMHGIVPPGAANVGNVAIGFGFTAENGDSDPSNNFGNAKASVPGATGTLVGDCMYDSNGNNQLDPGEGFEGLKVTLVGLYDIERIVTAYSDQNGKVRFEDLPVGQYEMRLTPPPGWWLQYGDNVSSALVLATGESQQIIQVEPIS